MLEIKHHFSPTKTKSNTTYNPTTVRTMNTVKTVTGASVSQASFCLDIFSAVSASELLQMEKYLWLYWRRADCKFGRVLLDKSGQRTWLSSKPQELLDKGPISIQNFMLEKYLLQQKFHKPLK